MVRHFRISRSSYFRDAHGLHRASPRLKDAEIPEADVQNLYLELVLDVRRMYHDCHLVHADLSEYNILYVPLLPYRKLV